jgi:SAM-dependent methyltransferase
VERPPADTRDEAYAAALAAREGARWKRWLRVQAPFRWNLRRLNLGLTLEVGCGVGRNLAHLAGRGVGVDHNPRAVAEARARGFEAYTEPELRASERGRPEGFDALLFCHVLEHMSHAQAVELVSAYTGLLRPGGRVVLVTPQEAGFRSDPSHVEFLDFEALERLIARLQLSRERSYSFPLPRACGRFFRYNEFVVVGAKP